MILFASMANKHILDKNIGLLGLPYVIKQAFGNTLGNIFLIDSRSRSSCAAWRFRPRRSGCCSRWRATTGCRPARRSRASPVTGKVPVVPALVTGILTLVLLAINVGNQSAFYVLTSLAIIMFYLAYLGVTAPMLVRRLRGDWPKPDHGPYFSLGRWGLLVNILGGRLRRPGHAQHRLAA